MTTARELIEGATLIFVGYLTYLLISMAIHGEVCPFEPSKLIAWGEVTIGIFLTLANLVILIQKSPRRKR